jgi:hypothetical protein
LIRRVLLCLPGRSATSFVLLWREWEGGEGKNFVDGKEEGKSVYYDEDGNITDEDIWKDGECVEMCEGDE